VQRPLLIPSLHKPVVTRDVGFTYAVIEGAIHNDGRSTVHIDLDASWVDPYDDANNPAGPQTTPGPFTSHQGRAFELPVQYGDTLTPITPGGLRHEFGDTKHRWVSYQPNAASRYKEYFPASVTSNPANITTPGVTEILNILSSKRPPPLQVLYAIPTFKWVTSRDGTTKTRVGNGIRVYFSRPWFVTGVDEMVGVCLLPSTTADAALSLYTSEWGTDPVWTSTAVSEPLQPEAFTNRVLTTPQPPDFSPRPPPLSTGPYALAEDNTLSVSVVGFFPEYNYDRNLWFVDIEMNPGDSYFPFVRLAMARFQPHSVNFGAQSSQHLSRVTRTEFMQLVPDRTASITPMGGGVLSVAVTGVGGYNAFAVATASSSSIDSTFGHTVTVQVQARPIGSANDLLWTNVGPQSLLATYSIDAPDVAVWKGEVRMPARRDSSQEYQLLIKETERYAADGDFADGVVGNTAYADRLVYACGIPLRQPLPGEAGDPVGGPL
jgi:hypothetical protein